MRKGHFDVTQSKEIPSGITFCLDLTFLNRQGPNKILLNRVQSRYSLSRLHQTGKKSKNRGLQNVRVR